MTHQLAIRTFVPESYCWSIGDSSCTFQISDHRPVDVDPFPGYAHDHLLVADVAEQVMDVWPPGGPLTLWLPDREHISRTNGFAERVFDIPASDDRWSAHIVLSGKRTPIHPAMSRFLVPHEYAHHVEWWLEQMRGLDPYDLRSDYAAMRGLQELYAAGGHWHDAAGEVLADDFRILICGIEMEHWPHPGIERPGGEVGAWWSDALAEWLTYQQVGRVVDAATSSGAS